MRSLSSVCVLAVVLGLAGGAAADPMNKVFKGRGGPPAVGHEVTGERAAHAVFSEIERRLIREYFRGKAGTREAGGPGQGARSMPHGLAKRDALPPGLAQHVARYGTLPPGLEKRDLPYDLSLRLPKLKRGLARKIVGHDVLLIEQATGLVLDILDGAAGG